MSEQEAFNVTMMNASEKAQAFAKTIDTDSASLKKLSKGIKESSTSSKALGVGLTLLNSLAVTALATLAQIAITKFYDNVVNRVENAYNKAKSIADSANQISTKTTDDKKTLDDLISKYKELRSSETYGSSERSQVASIQQQIVSLVGDEASNLDLVNGNLETQLGLLKQISSQKLQDAITDQKLATDAAIDVANKTPSRIKTFAAHHAYKGKRDDEVEKALQKHGMYGVGGNIGYVNDPLNGFRIDDGSDSGASLLTRLNYLRKIRSAIESEIANYQNNDVWKGVSLQIKEYEGELTKVTGEVNKQLQLLASQAMLGSSELDGIAKDTADGFGEYVDRIYKYVSESDWFKGYIEQGFIDEKSVQDYIVSMLSSDETFDKGRNAWFRSNRKENILDTIFGNGIGRNQRKEYDLFSQFIDSLSDEDLEIAYKLVLDENSQIETESQLKAAIEKAKTTVEQTEPISFEKFVSGDDIKNTFDPLVKEYQELAAARKKLQSGESKESDLIFAHPEWAQYADDLEAGLVRRASEIKEKLSTEYSHIVPDSEESKAAFEAWYNSLLAQLDEETTIQLPIDIEAETTGIDNVMSAIKESVSETGLAASQVDKLKTRYKELGKQGYNLDKLFDKTSGGIRLNTEALRELEDAYQDQMKSKVTDDLNEQLALYAQLTEQIKATGDADGSLMLERSGIANRINELRSLSAALDGITSKYNKWKKAQSGGEEGDAYNDTISGLKDLQDLRKKGLVGTNEFRAGVDFMTNKDMSTASVDELVKAYDEAYPKMQRYFTESEKGSQNFLKDLQAIGKATKGKDGVWNFDFGEGGIDEVTDKLGISAEAVYQILGRLKDYGFEVNLKSLFPDIDLEATTVSDALSEIDEKINQTTKDMADGKVSTEDGEKALEKYAQAKEALESIDTETDVSTLSLDEALAKIQELQAAISTLTSAGIDIPVTLPEELNQLMSFVLAPEHVSAVTLNAEGTDQVKQEIQEITDEDYSADVNVKTGEDTASPDIQKITEGENTAEISIKPGEDSASSEIQSIADKEHESKVDAVPGDDTASSKIQSISDTPYTATVSTQTDSTLGAVDEAIDAVANKPRTAKIATEIEKPITGDEPDYVDHTHVNEDGVVVGYSGVLPYKTRTPDNGKDSEIVPPKQTWMDEAIPENIEVDVKPSEDSGQNIAEQLQSDINNQPIDFNPDLDVDEWGLFSDNEEPVKVDVEASDPSKPIDQVKEAANATPIDLEWGDISKAGTAMEGLQSAARESGVNQTAEGVEAIRNLSNAYDQLCEAKEKAQNVEPGDATGAEESASELAAAASNFTEAYNTLANITGQPQNIQVDAETEAALQKIEAIGQVKPEVNIGVNSSAVDSYKPTDKTGKVKYTADASAISSWTPPTKQGKVVYTATGGGTTGGAKAEGTRSATEGEHLVDEEGAELIEHVSRGTYELGTNSGPRFTHLDTGDIVHTASETKSILQRIKNATIFTGRAFRLAGINGESESGTGKFYDGTSTSKKKSSKKKSKSSSKSKSSKKSSKSSKKENGNDTFDWIEVAIERVEQAITKLARVADSTFKGLATRLSATNGEIDAISKEISIQQQGYDRYMQEANKVNLTDATKAKIMDGTIDISQYSDKQKARIEQFKEFYDKAQQCSDAVEELKEKLSELYKNKFDTIQKDADNQMSVLEHLTNTYNNALDNIEERGYMGGQSLYTEMQKVEQNNIEIMKKELADLTQAMSDGINYGGIQEGSEAWYEMQQEINSVKEAIQESETAVVKYGNAIRDIEWEVFDYIQERISTITTESEFLFNLMNSSKLYDDKGRFTDTGNVQVGMTAMNYGVYMEQADKYAEEIKKIDADLAKDPNNTKLINRRSELLKLQQESISSAEDQKTAMQELVEEGINKELDALKDLIDAYEESLDSAKDLHDYQMKVKDQTKEIASLQKQIQAYKGDTSEENVARMQKLTVELSDAMEDLQETQYDQYIKDQKKLLDNLYDEYEQLLNERLDDIDALMREMIDYTNLHASEIAATIEAETNAVGYTVSDSINNIWNGFGGAVAEYYNGISGNQTAIKAAIDQTYEQVKSIVTVGNNIATQIAAQTAATTAAAAAASGGGGTAPAASAPAAAAASSNKTVTVKKDKQAYVYASGPKSGTKFKIIHEGETYTYLGEKDGYYKIQVGGKTGWVNSQYMKKNGFSQGGFIADLQKVAYQNGDDILSFNTLKRGEAVLDRTETVQFKRLTDYLPQLQGLIDISDYLKNIGNFGGTSNNEANIDVGGVTIQIDHVQDYNDFVRKLRDDKTFERMISSMTIDKLAGKSSLAKKKYYD